jgi:methyltransferase-like protein/cyclopropane fatty-acyl-phospholipid synthase-like methyltransferase
MAKVTTKTVQNKYDEVPYASFPFPQTDPSKQRATAHLFGLDCLPPAKAKILELGCASGNNILAIAARYPEAECVGVDLSKNQIDEGKKRIEELGIANLKLTQKSILDITPKFGKFDYIICHGVFSWVPKEVQDKILEICRDNLTPNGIAYVSYNTLPGWSAVEAMREMMLYHTANFSNPQEKAVQARSLLKFILESSKALNKNFYSDVIENELAILSNQSDWYLLHDHLEENNIQYYFHQFMDMAGKNNLQYLGDTDLASMFIGNLPEEAAKVLGGSDDIVRSEQYMDFITNRRFRCTMLCHKDRILKRNLQPSLIEDKYFTSRFATEENILEYRYAHGKTINFMTPNNMIFSTSDAEIIAALAILSQQKQKPMQMDELCTGIIELLSQQAVPVRNINELREYLAKNFLRNIFTGGIVLHLDEGLHCNFASVKPKAFMLAIYQAENQDNVTNLFQENVWLTPFDKALLPLLNGKNDIKTLTKKILPLFANGSLSMNLDDKKISDIKLIEKNLPESISSILSRYAEIGLLIE